MGFVSMATIWMVLTGGFVASMLFAALRRDGPAVLAMAVGGLVAGHLGRLPAPVLAWGAIAVAVALAAALLGWMIAALCGGRSGYLPALVLTGATLGAIVSAPATAAQDRNRGPAAGRLLSRALTILATPGDGI